nr:phage baseplate assembly protein V [Pararoseomonas baculiformis]
MPRVPVAVGAFGLSLLPEEGELVLVVFAEGDWHAPVVLGGLYHAALAPPATDASLLALHLPKGEAQPKLRLEVERSGDALRLNLGEEASLTATADTLALAIGKIALRLTSKGGGRLELAAGGSTITLKEDGDIVIEAKGKLVLSGAELEAKGSGKAALKGATVEIN